jgi:hypothetical protein
LLVPGQRQDPERRSYARQHKVSEAQQRDEKTKAFTGNLSPVGKFLDAMRIRELEAKPKLSITSSLLPGSTQTMILNHV